MSKNGFEHSEGTEIIIKPEYRCLIRSVDGGRIVETREDEKNGGVYVIELAPGIRRKYLKGFIEEYYTLRLC